MGRWTVPPNSPHRILHIWGAKLYRLALADQETVARGGPCHREENTAIQYNGNDLLHHCVRTTSDIQDNYSPVDPRGILGVHRHTKS